MYTSGEVAREARVAGNSRKGQPGASSSGYGEGSSLKINRGETRMAEEALLWALLWALLLGCMQLRHGVGGPERSAVASQR